MDELKQIKKYYGENMMHLCRSLFPTLLEQENLLINLLESNFAHSKYLYEDIVKNKQEEEFKNYIYSFTYVEKEEIEIIKSPEELLNEAGYILYECKTEEDIQYFKKYYAKNEELCTFRGNRLDKCHVFFAIKKNVDEIKRENFPYPARQDEYGTSVISIQFSKGEKNTLSIKNRYNHSVNNPDATFSNDLENIIPGLTKSFEKRYNLNINQNENNNFELPGYVKANDGKYYKYNCEINNICYCPDNIIIDNFEVKKDYQEKEKYIIIDYFVLDLVNKKIYLYDKNIFDDFISGLEDIDNIEISKDKSTNKKTIKITLKNKNQAYVKMDKYNRIIGYKNENLTTIGSNFLYRNKKLTSITLPQATTIGDCFLHWNRKLTSITLPQATTIGHDFLNCNRELKSIYLPQVTTIGDGFLTGNEILTSITLPQVTTIGDRFLENNRNLTSITLLQATTIGDRFLNCNYFLTSITLPQATTIGEGFLACNSFLTSITLPQATTIGDDFLYYNRKLKSIYLPQVTTIGDGFLTGNIGLTSITLPQVTTIGNRFLHCNEEFTSISLPQVTTIGHDFLNRNRELKSIYLPQVTTIGDRFLASNNEITSITLPQVTTIGDRFLENNRKLTSISLPQATTIGDNFLFKNQNSKEILSNIKKSNLRKSIIALYNELKEKLYKKGKER